MSKPGPLCHLCPLEHASGPVWGEGPPSAKLVIIGQNPGDEELKVCRPFIGGSGTVLDMAIAKAGGSRDRSFVTNAVKCYVKPGLPVPQKAIECCRPLLQQELNLLRDGTTILTLGAESFQALTGKRLVIKHNREAHEKDPNIWLRGCVYQIEKTTLIPTMHPAFVMRTGFAASFEFEVDVQRAVEFAIGIRSLPKESLIENPCDREVDEYIDTIIAQGEGGIDLETSEIAVDDDELDSSIVVPIKEIGLSANVGESILIHPNQFNRLERLFSGRREKTVLWAHSANFDVSNLQAHFSISSIRPACSMLATYVLWSHLTGFDLATCQSLMIDIPYYKNWRKCKPELYATLGNCRDAYSTLWIGREALKQMASKPIDMRPMFWRYMMEVMPLVIDWCKTGVRIDTDEADRLALQMILQLKGVEEVWNRLFPLVDWGSNKQLIQLFTGVLKLPPILRERVRKDKSRYKSPTIDDDALQLYIDKYDCKTAQLIQVMRGLRSGVQLASAHEDGWLHARLKQHAQVGGRIQSTGERLQNIPEELPLFPQIRPRKMVVGDTEDCLVICADFSQIEFREYVWYAEAKNLRDILASGAYIYGILYEQLFGEPFFKPGGNTKKFKRDDIPAWKLLLAKTYPMGFIYGRQPKDKLGARLYSEFHSANPEISAFHSRLFLQVSRDRYYQTVFGRMRRFANAKAVRNEVLSCPGQLTAVDILNKNALLPLAAAFQTLECEGIRPRIMFPQYDSVEISVHKNQAEEVAALVLETMQRPIPEMDNLIIPAEVHIGPSWDTK